MSIADNYGWEMSLSMVANEQTRTAQQRQGVTLLRPVFMNAVEVGYSYAHCDRDKKLNVRGVTIALWHFICRGHQAIALLPYCFKNYAEKSSRYSELMMLYRLNLIEFTPGYGSEKYAEVNRIMVNRAYETGGCLVARSQMQGITDNKAHLIDVVEKRLLMPTFNGDDIMFPIDGPLGRNGPSLKQTLECPQASPDWRACSEHQLLLSDQRHWLEKLALLVPEKVPWTRLVQVIQTGGEFSPSRENNMNGFDPLAGLDPPVSPSSPPSPVENPFVNRGSAAMGILPVVSHSSQGPHPSPPTGNSQFYDTLSYNQVNPPHHQHHLPNPHQLHRFRQQMSPPRRFHGGRPNSTTRLILRYGPTNGTTPSDDVRSDRTYRQRSKHSATTDSVVSTASTQSGEGENAQPLSPIIPDSDEDLAKTLNNQLAEEERLEEASRRKAEMAQKKKDELLAKLSQIFGYSKSSRVIEKFPEISTFCLLVEKCISEEDQEGDGCDFADVRAEEQHEQHQEIDEEIAVTVEELVTSVVDMAEIQVSEPPKEPEEEDLIDFSMEPIVHSEEVLMEEEQLENTMEEPLVMDFFT